MTIHAALASTLIAVTLLSAQTLPPPPKYTYDVVSIHRSDPTERSSGFGPGAQGGLKARNNTVVGMLAFAYDVRDYQIVGAPGWATTERFEVNLTPDKSEIVLDSNTGRAELEGWLTRNRQRMQAVLRDRFGLVLRAETRDLPTGILTVAKQGHKLTPAVDPDHGQSFNINNGRLITAKSANMKMLATSLSMILGRYVRDETGLDGAFDFKLEWAPDLEGTRSGETASSPDPARASIFTALTEQLGLRLDSKKGPVPVFVIEKVEHPTEN